MFGNLGKMMKVAAEMKRRMPEVQAKLEQAEHTADAGGGAVGATVNGKGKVRDVRIDPSVLADGQLDAEILGDLIKAAISAAQEKAALATAEAMRELTGGMDLPGMEGMF